MSSEVSPGLHLLSGAGLGVNAFLWHPEGAGRDRTILFDCGYPWSVRRLVEELAALGCPPRSIGTLAITHDDIDHAGGLASLVSAGAGDVVAHRLEAPRIQATQWRRPPQLWTSLGSFRRLADTTYSLSPHPAVRVTRPLEDGDAVADGWLLVHTPGHTAGHASYFRPQTRTLIAGDALGVSPLGKLRSPMSIYVEDPIQAACSIRKLAGMAPDVLCLGHGRIMANASTRLRRFADSLSCGATAWSQKRNPW